MCPFQNAEQEVPDDKAARKEPKKEHKMEDKMEDKK